MKHLVSILIGSFASIWLSAQPARLILSQEEGRITFAVDEVDLQPGPQCQHAGMDYEEMRVETFRLP